jgi:predicted nucleotidyltransferase
MNICGIISEYNPFHHGHAYHLQKTRTLTDADAVVCVMSGNFTQRGEPAILDKWIRAEAALAAGADIVIELPVLGALQSAEGFALCGVSILNGIGAQMISFGSETKDISLLQKTADLLAKEPLEYKKSLRVYLDEGVSYPAARAKAVAGLLGLSDHEYEIVSSSNAILAIEYLKAMIKTQSAMQPLLVERKGSAYCEQNLQGKFSSATAVRREIEAFGFTGPLAETMPDEACQVYEKHLAAGALPVFSESFCDMLLYALRMGGPGYIRSLYDAGEGLENRIYEAACRSASVESLLAMVKTRRYTRTRLSRILMYALLGITREAVLSFNSRPPYARVLGIRRGAETTLAHICRQSTLPIVTRPAQAEGELIRFDVLASDIYALTQKQKPYQTARRDFTEKLIKA